jgi:hypothetical protein
VTVTSATTSRSSTMCRLDDLARALLGHGWVVRLELRPCAFGAAGGHLVVTRPLSRKVEYLIARPDRHQIHVWGHSGDHTWPLGAVLDADEVHDLLRCNVKAPGHAEELARADQNAVR